VPRKFPVAADTDESVIKAYDAVLTVDPQYANRTSYVIAPNGTILYSYTDLHPVSTFKTRSTRSKRGKPRNPARSRKRFRHVTKMHANLRRIGAALVLVATMVAIAGFPQPVHAGPSSQLVGVLSTLRNLFPPTSRKS